MRSIWTSLAGALLASVLASAPVGANPPERTLGPGFGEFYDPATNTFVLANITGAAWCDWARGGFVGDPDVIDLTEVMEVSTGGGATVFRFHESWQLEAYRYPTVAESPVEECALMEEHGIWATGTATITLTDNDASLSGPGANALGWSVNGSLTDAAGQSHRFARLFRALILDGEFLVLVSEISIR